MIPKRLPDKWFRNCSNKWNFVLYIFPLFYFFALLVVQNCGHFVFILLVVSFEIYGYLTLKYLKLISALAFLPPNADLTPNLIISHSAYAIFLSIIITCKYRYMKVKKKRSILHHHFTPETAYYWF